jgi:hypothetical protein
MPAPVLIDRDEPHVVARGIERAEDRARRRHRHFVLDGSPAEQQPDAKLRHHHLPHYPARNVCNLESTRCAEATCPNSARLRLAARGLRPLAG